MVVGIVAIAGGSVWWSTQKPKPSNPSAASANPSGKVANPLANTMLGHYAYAEAPAADLEPIVADGSIKLRHAAAQAYKQMVAAAQADGVTLVPISGFRSIQDQEGVFFSLKEARSQTVSQRADVSAPPGYSEHHTGYAIDIGDGDVPATNLSPDFDHTPAFKWLQTHAAQYNFEMSFPKGNPQGVSYEPWHWRFVGDRASLETFFRARGKQ